LESGEDTSLGEEEGGRWEDKLEKAPGEDEVSWE
jgi:hypothetical protein